MTPVSPPILDPFTRKRGWMAVVACRVIWSFCSCGNIEVKRYKLTFCDGWRAGGRACRVADARGLPPRMTPALSGGAGLGERCHAPRLSWSSEGVHRVAARMGPARFTPCGRQAREASRARGVCRPPAL